jgi:hypothetical protein
MNSFCPTVLPGQTNVVIYIMTACAWKCIAILFNTQYISENTWNSSFPKCVIMVVFAVLRKIAKGSCNFKGNVPVLETLAV